MRDDTRFVCDNIKFILINRENPSEQWKPKVGQTESDVKHPNINTLGPKRNSHKQILDIKFLCATEQLDKHTIEPPPRRGNYESCFMSSYVEE